MEQFGMAMRQPLGSDAQLNKLPTDGVSVFLDRFWDMSSLHACKGNLSNTLYPSYLIILDKLDDVTLLLSASFADSPHGNEGRLKVKSHERINYQYAPHKAAAEVSKIGSL